MIKLKNLFEQAVTSKIKTWFDSNKSNTVNNFNTIGAGVGGELKLPLKGQDWGAYGAGIQLCLDQMLQKYRVNSFLTNGEPNTKVTNKKGQWESTVQKIPIKIQGGGKIVTSVQPNVAGSIDSWSTPDRFVGGSIYERLESINAFNLSQWLNGNQVINIIPEQVDPDQLGTSNIKLSKSILSNKQNKGILSRNKLQLGKLKQQLVIYSPYAQAFQKGKEGTPDKIIPGDQLPIINVGDGFETAHYVLKQDAKQNIIQSIADLKKEIINSGLKLSQIPKIVIRAGTDKEPISDATKKARGIKDNQDLANRRANSIKQLLVSQGFPEGSIDINLSGVNGGAPLYTFPAGSTSTQKQAIMKKWREENKDYRFVKLEFPGLEIPGKVIPGKSGSVDRFVVTRTLDSEGNISLTQDAVIYKLTLNLIKP